MRKPRPECALLAGRIPYTAVFLRIGDSQQSLTQTPLDPLLPAKMNRDEDEQHRSSSVTYWWDKHSLRCARVVAHGDPAPCGQEHSLSPQGMDVGEFEKCMASEGMTVVVRDQRVPSPRLKMCYWCEKPAKGREGAVRCVLRLFEDEDPVSVILCKTCHKAVRGSLDDGCWECDKSFPMLYHAKAMNDGTPRKICKDCFVEKYDMYGPPKPRVMST